MRSGLSYFHNLIMKLFILDIYHLKLILTALVVNLYRYAGRNTGPKVLGAFFMTKNIK